jgi:hypothetical protein
MQANKNFRKKKSRLKAPTRIRKRSLSFNYLQKTDPYFNTKRYVFLLVGSIVETKKEVWFNEGAAARLA